MIIATAGHVDHGKTSLLKRLTGVDADRLPEEKKRGLTIDIGFAYSADLRPGEITGFVDVPGHEKFIHNMLAGVTAIDAALLVVAADDGPMPQTLEHLAILDLVGVSTGLVALTKIDGADDARVAVVEGEISALIAPTSLASAPVLSVSSLTGKGIDDLIGALKALRPTPKTEGGDFRMAIDRSFVVDGVGLVVTGLAQAGSLRIGDRLFVNPSGARGLEVRIRGLRTQDTPADRAQAGDRCAVNLSGPAVEKATVGRGQWLVASGQQSASRRIDIDLTLLLSEAAPLKHWTPVHVHVGTADVPGRVAVLESDLVAPGETAVVQLVLDRAVCVCRGDAVILRDQSAQRTIGGGPVLDAEGPRRGRAAPQRLSLLRAQRRDDPSEALAAMLDAAPGGVDLLAFARNRNLADADLDALAVPGSRRVGPTDSPVAILDRHFNQMCLSIRRRLEAQAAATPGDPGLPVAQLLIALPGRPSAVAAGAAVDRLVKEGIAIRAGDEVMLAGQRKALNPRDAGVWEKMAPALLLEGRPQTVWEVSEALNLPQQDVARFLKRAQSVGLVNRISKNRFLTVAALHRLAATAESGLAKKDGDRFTVADFRDWSGLGRNLSVEMLEYFDRAGFTRRAGNERIIRKAAADVFSETSS